MNLQEIYSLKSSEFTGYDELRRYSVFYNENIQYLKPLKDNKDILHSIVKKPGGRIWIFVANLNKELMGVLSLDLTAFSLDLTAFIDNNSYTVDAIVVNPKYRGMGVAQYLYKIALRPKPYGLGITLVSGEYQTPGGKSGWLKFKEDPNIEITGFFAIHDSIIHHEKYSYVTSQYDTDTLLDHLFGKIGAQLIAINNNYYIYAFPLKFLKTRLAGMVETSILKLYAKNSNNYSGGIRIQSGMFARYKKD
jgi:GNAT superfamily N-acetyltransferase